MAIQVFSGRSDFRLAYDTTTFELHIAKVAGDGTVTDLGQLKFPVGGITLDAPTINVGNVGLMSADETEIDLPKALDANSHLKVGLNASDPGVAIVVGRLGATTDTKADVDGNGSAIGHLRRIGFEADRIGDIGDVLTSAPTAKTLTAASKGVSVPGTGEAIVAAQTFARSVWFVAKKATGVNAGNVYLGTSAVDKTTDQQIELQPGDSFLMPVPAGTKIDLNTIYVDAITAADGVVFQYIPV